MKAHIKHRIKKKALGAAFSDEDAQHFIKSLEDELLAHVYKERDALRLIRECLSECAQEGPDGTT